MSVIVVVGVSTAVAMALSVEGIGVVGTGRRAQLSDVGRYAPTYTGTHANKVLSVSPLGTDSDTVSRDRVSERTSWTGTHALSSRVISKGTCLATSRNHTVGTIIGKEPLRTHLHASKVVLEKRTA